MSWGPLLVNLAVTAAVVAVLMLGTFAYAMLTKVHAIVDTIWPLGFVLIALVSFGLSAGAGSASGAGGCWCSCSPRCGGCGSARTSSPATAGRARTSGTPRCCGATAGTWPSSCCATSTGCRAGSCGSCRCRCRRPCTSTPRSAVRPGWGRRCGRWGSASRRSATRSCAGSGPIPANAGRVLDTGLWRYTRHPNYFGDAVVWFGLWLLACSHWLGLLLVACPVFMTNMLVRHTGKKLLEKHMARSKGDAYADYVRRTSGFIPWPPRLAA